jgi:hypothetical protein
VIENGRPMVGMSACNNRRMEAWRSSKKLELHFEIFIVIILTMFNPLSTMATFEI